MDANSASVGAAHARRYTENRLVGRALKFWELARGRSRLPDVAAFDSADCPFGADNVMIISVGETEAEDTVVAAGSLVIAALGRDPTGMPVLNVLPSSVEMGLSFCRASIDLAKPMADVGRFFNRQGHEVLYRSILLPVSRDGVTVDRIVTAFSYKVVH